MSLGPELPVQTRWFPIQTLWWDRLTREAFRVAALEPLSEIPWAMIAPHERQAQRNHGQSLATLAARWGLSACEAVAVLEGRRWEPMGAVAAQRRLHELVAAWARPTDTPCA